VFDDMVSRSVPFYAEIQRMLAELAASFATEGSNIYDLGCSTGTTLALLHETLPVNAHLCGIDYSAEMLDKCRAKLAQSDRLDRQIDGIAGATLSVGAMERMARLALFFDRMSRR